MKKLFMMVALSLVIVACNKEETEQLVGWDKIVAEVGQTDKSAVEVLQSLTEDEIWHPYNWSDFSEDKDGNIIETKYVENGTINYFGGGSLLGYRMSNDGNMLEISFSMRPGPIYYYISQDVDIQEGHLRITRYQPSGDEIKSITSWEILAYDKNQIVIKSTFEYIAPLYYPDGEIYTSENKGLYSLIQLVRYIPKDQDWKEAISEKDYNDL